MILLFGAWMDVMNDMVGKKAKIVIDFYGTPRFYSGIITEINEDIVVFLDLKKNIHRRFRQKDVHNIEIINDENVVTPGENQ